MLALSIRQPWAWLIANGYKDIENRNWSSLFRGWFLIHASGGMTKAEYEDAWEFLAEQHLEGKLGSIPVPNYPMKEHRGGIIGIAKMTGCVKESDSPWFFGEYGFQIEQAKPLPFMPLKGKLGFFNVDIEDRVLRKFLPKGEI